MSTSQKKRGISIYPAADAPDLGETDFMRIDPAKLAPGFLELFGELAENEDARHGIDSKVLVRDAAGFSLLYLGIKPGFPVPRHSHDSDCLYYVISGRAVLGNRELRGGDSFFVPAHAPYQYSAGPEGAEVLEIRYGVEHFDLAAYGDPDDFRRLVMNAIDGSRDA
jgi:quercetin dioxygenase-like cupin family protein